MKKVTMICVFLLTLLLSQSAQAMSVYFQWGTSTGQVDGYRIYWGDTQGGPYQNKLCEVSGTTLNYNATLDEDQEYYLVCRAFNSYGESGDSNEVHWSYAIPGIPGTLQWSVNLITVMKELGADQIVFVSRD